MNTVLVSGAARGLGLAISRRLIGDGYKVIGFGRTHTDEFAELERGGKAIFEEFDLANLEDIQPFVYKLNKTHGPIFGLVNNAAIARDGVLATLHASDIASMLTVNLEATILLTKYASRPMLVRRQGRIITISSIIATTGFSGLSVYAATKAALEGFTRSLSRELGRVNVTVNCVAPGYMETDMTAALDGDKLDSIRRRTSLGLPEPEDAAGAVAYLLSENARKITGTVITVDGGSTA